MKDDLCSEYYLTQLKDRKLSSEMNIYLEPDVIKFFPTPQAVNEALRFLIKATKIMLKFVKQIILTIGISITLFINPIQAEEKR